MQPRYSQPETLDRPVTQNQTKNAAPRSPERGQEKARDTRQKQIEFRCTLPQARSVAVAGTFNNWDQHKTPMQKEGNGWKAKVSLSPGRYEYRFVADGQWVSDPNARESVRNDYGSTNSVLVV